MLSNWVFTLMLALQPNAPWLETYPATAAAIAEVAEEEPVFSGEKGPQHTASLLVSLSWFESRFNAKAVGDHGASIGLYQINEHNFTIPARIALDDPYIATREAVRLIRISQRECRTRPVESMLGWYAWGRSGCEHYLDKSAHRVNLAKRLEREHPFDLI